MAIVSSATCQVGRRLNSLRYAACEQVRKRQEVEPGDIVWVAPVQTQAVFKAWLRLISLARVERRHAKHQVSEGEAGAEIDGRMAARCAC
jgi:hypothetical protein